MTDDMILINIGGIVFLGIVGALTAVYIYSQKHKANAAEAEVKSKKKNRWGCLPLMAVIVYAILKFASLTDEKKDKSESPENDLLKEPVSQISRNISDDQSLSTSETESFTGVRFGEDLTKMAHGIEDHDGSNFRSKGHWSSMSYREANYVPTKPFRNFKRGYIYASWKSSSIYEIRYVYEFPRSNGVAADDMEVEETLKALTKKYRQRPQKETGIGGDVDYTFKANDIVISLTNVKEGFVDKARMILYARNVRYYKLAQEESDAYMKEQEKNGAEKVKSGGEDAL